jgi:hypothetical protein
MGAIVCVCVCVCVCARKMRTKYWRTRCPTLDRYHSNRIINETLSSGVFDEEHGTNS